MLLRPSLLVLVVTTGLCIPSIENTFIPLPFSELVSKAVHLYGPPVSNSSQFNPQHHPFPCLSFTCRGRIQKLWFVARRQSQFPDTRPPTFHILRKYQGPEYCNDTGPSDRDCEYYLWLRLNWNEQQPLLVYGNDTVGVYETILTANNSFERGDILGVPHPLGVSLQVLYQSEGRYCDTLGDITIHLLDGQTRYPRQNPVLPYIAIETDTSNQHCAMGFLKNESLQVIVDAPRDNRIYNSFNILLSNIQSMPINESGLLEKFFTAAKFDHTISSGWPLLQIRRRIHTSNSLNLVFSTAMEPRPTGYLNVFKYNVQNMTFDVQHNDIIRIFWPPNMNILRRYSLAYFGNRSNMMLSIKISQTASTTDDSISTREIQHHTEIVTTASGTSSGSHDLISTTGDDLENMTSSITTIADTPGPMITDAPIVATITSFQMELFGNITATNNTRSIIIGSLICTILLALMLLSIAMVIIILTCRHHKNRTTLCVTQHASKDFDMDSNQAKHDEAVQDCIEMDANQAYITHSETKGEQGAGRKEMGANQGYICHGHSSN